MRPAQLRSGCPTSYTLACSSNAQQTHTRRTAHSVRCRTPQAHRTAGPNRRSPASPSSAESLLAPMADHADCIVVDQMHLRETDCLHLIGFACAEFKRRKVFGMFASTAVDLLSNLPDAFFPLKYIDNVGRYVLRRAHFRSRYDRENAVRR